LAIAECAAHEALRAQTAPLTKIIIAKPVFGAISVAERGAAQVYISLTILD
jgi:hypothetical protein